MNEERPEIGIYTLRNPQEGAFPSTRVLSGNESEPGGELTAVFEAVRIANQRQKSRCRKDADSRDFQKHLADGVTFGDGLNGLVAGSEMRLGFPKLLCKVPKLDLAQGDKDVSGARCWARA